MPTSRPLSLNYICSKVLQHKPKSILDIGVGFGKWGLLVREYTDIWKGKIQKEQWTTVIHGIEVFEPYITPASKYIYDKIFIGNVIEIIKKLGKYDMTICVAMLEHLDKQEGTDLIKYCKKYSRLSFFVLPIEPGTRGGKHGNPYQAHVSKWTEEELAVFGRVRSLHNKQWLLEM